MIDAVVDTGRLVDSISQQIGFASDLADSYLLFYQTSGEARYRLTDRDYSIAGPFNYSADRLVSKPRSIRWRQVCTADNNDIRRNNDCRSLYRVVIERMIAHQCPAYREYNSCHDKNRCVHFYS